MIPNRCLTPEDVRRITQRAAAFKHANRPECQDCAYAAPNGGVCAMRSNCLGFKPRARYLTVVQTPQKN